MKTEKLYITRDRQTSNPSVPATFSLQYPKSPNNQAITEIEVVLPENLDIVSSHNNTPIVCMGTSYFDIILSASNQLSFIDHTNHCRRVILNVIS